MRYLSIAFLIFASISGLLHAQETGVTATAYQTVNVRSGPSTQDAIIGQLSEGDTVTVLGRDSEATRWLYIGLPGSRGLRGWVAVFTVTTNGGLETLEVFGEASGNDSEPSPEPIDGVMITAFGRVNVRSGPGIAYIVTGQLEIEEEAHATARSNYNNDWLHIENESLAGWVAYFTVTVRGNADELPVLVPDTIDGDLVPPSTLISANFNVRLHSRPAFTAPVTGIIPYQTQVTPVGISANGRWLYVVYEDIEGWASTTLFEITDEQMAQIPRRSTLDTPTPTPALVPTQAATAGN